MDAKAIRQRMGLNQGQFWSRIGVTQSGGSRYESGERPIPKPVQLLMALAYGSKREAEKVEKQIRS